MKFNVIKYATIQFGTKTNKRTFSYIMKWEPLEIVNHHQYLGVQVSDNLKYNIHIDNTCKKGSSVLQFLKRNCRYWPSKVKD
jgi:hypothetical protein